MELSKILVPINNGISPKDTITLKSITGFPDRDVLYRKDIFFKQGCVEIEYVGNGCSGNTLKLYKLNCHNHANNHEFGYKIWDNGKLLLVYARGSGTMYIYNLSELLHELTNSTQLKKTDCKYLLGTEKVSYSNIDTCKLYHTYHQATIDNNVESIGKVESLDNISILTVDKVESLDNHENDVMDENESVGNSNIKLGNVLDEIDNNGHMCDTIQLNDNRATIFSLIIAFIKFVFKTFKNSSDYLSNS